MHLGQPADLYCMGTGATSSEGLVRRLLSLAIVGAGMAAVAGCGAAQSAHVPSRSPGAAPGTENPKAQSSLATLVAKTRSGVIRIEANGCAGQAVGTGVVIGPRLVATVEHVVAGASTISLKQDGRIVSSATVIGEDSARDVALLRTSSAINGYVFSLASRAPQLGDSVAALGFPLGLPLTVTRGSVGGTARTIPINGIDRRDLVQTDAAVNPGNSGGPLISTDTGQVVGFVDLGTSGLNGIAFAVSSQVAQPLLQAWQAAPQPLPAALCSNPDGSPSGPPVAPPASGTPTGVVNGQDGGGFNVGQGCSDNPHSSLLGCNDSPSMPVGDSARTCAGGITIDAQTTTCGLAQAVLANYQTDGPVSVLNPDTGQNERLSCLTGGSGTTGYVFCQGEAASGALYLRWHP